MMAAASAPEPNGEFGSWPAEASHEPKLTISKVCEILSQEFPSVTQAKLRLFETHGIVNPARKANGYRSYSEADIQRLRYALTQQRDTYIPLAEIGNNLRVLDLGDEPAQTEPVMRLVSSEGQIQKPQPNKRITIRQLMDYTGVDSEELERIVAAKFITPDLSGRFPSAALPVVNALLSLRRFGIEPRHLRSIRSAANSSIDLVDQVVSPQRRANNAAAAERVRAQATALGKELGTLGEALINLGVAELE